ncbi:unnamed protein product [Brugia timori]|uniref:3-dehydroquinate dehydratase n=1 Tax=Brugia timori TaxID=42155 RepID=A0A0R3R029_9BILA|nr:unnamed protein product [Brugia timori]
MHFIPSEFHFCKQFQLAKGRDIIGIVNRIKDAVVDESGKAVARDIIEMAYSL